LAATTLHIPKWTKYVVTELGGRDPLGLSSVAYMIAGYLLHGITSTTGRARYYSFYPWVLRHVEKTEDPVRREDFVKAFGRREVFLALTTLHNRFDSESVAGAERVRPKLTHFKDTGEVDTSMRLLQDRMGGYGQYYGGSLYALGLTHRTEDGIDRTAPGPGEALAEAFEHSVAHTPYLKRVQYQERIIPFRLIEKSAQAFSLDSLDEEAAAGERTLLRNLFFGWDTPNPSHANILQRHTLGLILHIVSEYGKARIKAYESDTYLVYPAYYYGVLLTDNAIHAPYTPPDVLAPCYGFWQQFCLHEFLTQALEKLLSCILEVVNLQPSGIPLADVSAVLSGDEFRESLTERFGAGSRPAELLASLGMRAVPDDLACDEARKKIDIDSPKSEWELLNLNGSPSKVAAAAVGILAVLYGKWRGGQNEFARYIGIQANSNLWFGEVLPALDDWLNPTLDWTTALISFLERFVLDQHDRVMYGKGRLDSCWLHRLDGKVYKDQDYRPVFRASRHWNCVRILRDLGLVDYASDNSLYVTTDGRRELNRILKSDGTPKQ